MEKMKRLFVREDGATAIEYALIAAGIAVAIIVAVQTLGGDLASTFQQISCSVSGGTWDATNGTCS